MNSIQDYLNYLREKNKLVEVDEEYSTELEIAKKIHDLNGQAVLFNNVKGFEMKVCANLYTSKQSVAEFLGCEGKEITQKMLNAINNPSKNKFVETNWIDFGNDLNKLPFLKHVKQEKGKYLSSGFFIARGINGELNASFQRGMIIDSNKMVLRILERNLHKIIQETPEKKIKVACVIGNTPNTLLGVATSVPFGVFELEISNTIQELDLTKSPIHNLPVPANAEIIIEVEINANELSEEGPFIDITGTLDIVRKQPVFTVEKIWVKKNTIFQALLPGGLEHKMLMGTPREPTIFNEVNKVTKCLDVLISPGGCSWLHGIVKIEKQSEEDGKKAIQAAFKGHSSMKHCFVVSEDINIFDEKEIEWSMATRFQANKDLIIMENQKGSSLDPSADPNTRITTKVGFDLTKPIGRNKEFVKIKFD